MRHHSTPFILLLAGIAASLCAPCQTLAEPALRDTIDAHIEAKWKTENIQPASPADDAVFLRRVYLDVIGTVPTYEETTQFLADNSKDKRTKLIDKLLADPRYGEHQGNVWDVLLFGRFNSNYYARSRPEFQKWIREQFDKNVPYDKIVQTILKAEGNTKEQGPPMYLVQFKNAPESAAISVTRTFLGMQLQCAQCHDHPFEDFTQIDFYGMAGFFARLRVVDAGGKKIVVAERNTGEVLFVDPTSDADSKDKGKPVPAKFLKGDVVAEPELPKDFKEPRTFPSGKIPPKPKFSRRDKLVEWIVRPENPYFAKAIVNRIWAQYMGRGIVYPVDNIGGSESPPSHPELLDKLTRAMIEKKFDLKYFVRELLNSRVYQIGSHGGGEEDLPLLFERAAVRPLSFEQYSEALFVVSGFKEVARKKKQAASQSINQSHYSSLKRLLGKPYNGAGDYQSSMQTQLYLNNDSYFRGYTNGNWGTLYGSLTASKASTKEKVQQLYLTILNRPPNEAESKVLMGYLDTQEDKKKAIQDAIWVLISSAEFRFNH